jgi:hypothetical protein
MAQPPANVIPMAQPPANVIPMAQPPIPNFKFEFNVPPQNPVPLGSGSVISPITNEQIQIPSPIEEKSQSIGGRKRRTRRKRKQHKKRKTKKHYK